jgi:xylitol oxidase
MHRRYLSTLRYAPTQKLRSSADYEQLRSNWAENVMFAPTQLLTPSDRNELCAAVAAASSVRVLGSGHSFNHIIDSPDATMISLSWMQIIDEINAESMTVTIDGGVTYGQLARYLAPRGCALKNMASFPQLTVAGAISTGTHGSGVYQSNLASQIQAIEFVVGDGSIKAYTREENGHDFLTSLVGLGCLGIVSRLTLDIVPAFDVEQRVYRGMPLQVSDVESMCRSTSVFCMI